MKGCTEWLPEIARLWPVSMWYVHDHEHPPIYYGCLSKKDKLFWVGNWAKRCLQPLTVTAPFSLPWKVMVSNISCKTLWDIINNVQELLFLSLGGKISLSSIRLLRSLYLISFTSHFFPSIIRVSYLNIVTTKTVTSTTPFLLIRYMRPILLLRTAQILHLKSQPFKKARALGGHPFVSKWLG